MRFFLLAGTKKALLIDSGMMVNNCCDITKELTDLPISLLNTHADRDHIGSNEQFTAFYMHPAEKPAYRRSRKPGTIIPVQEGDVIRFALKQRYTEGEPLIYKEIPHNGMNLRLEAEETKALKTGGAPYVYDVQITMEDGTVCTFIDRAKLTVTEEVG